MNDHTFSRFTPFTCPESVALDLNALTNFVFVFQFLWELDTPRLKRRAEIIRDAQNRGITVWPGCAEIVDQSKIYIIVCGRSLPPLKEIGRDKIDWTYITQAEYNRLVERCEYQSFTLRALHLPRMPESFPLNNNLFQRICRLDPETEQVWRDCKAILHAWLFQVEQDTGLTKAGPLERRLLAIKSASNNHLSQGDTHRILREAFEQEDRRRRDRAFSPTETEISMRTYVSLMEVDPNQYGPQPELKIRHLPFRLPEILNTLPQPLTAAAYTMVSTAGAVDGGSKLQTISRWVKHVSRYLAVEDDLDGLENEAESSDAAIFADVNHEGSAPPSPSPSEAAYEREQNPVEQEEDIPHHRKKRSRKNRNGGELIEYDEDES